MSRETSLVTADWVASNLNDPKVVIVEVDEDTTLYSQGHIENAITFHWRDDLQDGLIRDLISKEKFEALLSKSGISNDSTVILYGGNNNWFHHVLRLVTLQRIAITLSAHSAMKSLQLLAQRTSLMFAHLLNSQENLQHLLTFHKKADRSRAISQLRRTFLGQRLQMKMEHLNQMQS